MNILKFFLTFIGISASIIFMMFLVDTLFKMRISHKQFHNFNERRMGVDSEVFLTFDEFMNYYSLAPDKYADEYDDKPNLHFCCYIVNKEKIIPAKVTKLDGKFVGGIYYENCKPASYIKGKKIQIGFKTFKDYVQYTKWVCEIEKFDEKLKKQKETAEFLNYVQDDINALREQSANEMRVAAEGVQQVRKNLERMG